MKLDDVTKVDIGFYPTPLQKLPRLSESIGKADIYMKRDDLTGIGGGGNKLRKLEYIVEDAINQGCNTLLTFGGVQTNHGRLTVAAASKYGLKSVIMCYGLPPERMSGNLVLDKMMGCELVFMDTTEVRKLPPEDQANGYYKLKGDSLKDVIARYEKNGDKVYTVPIGGHSPLGTLGYFYAVQEIMEQCKEQKITPEYLVTSNGSGGTYAGLWLGAKYFNAPFKVKGLSVSAHNGDAAKTMSDFINEVSEEFDLGVTSTPEEMDLSDAYCGVGYNIPDIETRKAAYTLAEKEAILVDPCYTGKGFRGLMDLVDTEVIPKDSSVIFLHTGGIPGIWTEEHEDAMQDDLWIGKNKVYSYKAD